MSHENWLKRMDWGHVAVVLGIALGIALYLANAMQASSRVGNLVLILPASVLGLILCVIILASIVRDAVHAVKSGEPAPEAEPLYERMRPILMLALFALYILLLPVLGMDLGSVIFIALALIANGERRPVFIAVYSVLFAVVVTLLFKWILPYPLQTLFL